MPKINVYLPDELAEAVRELGLPVSAICQRALEQAVRRVTAIRETALGDLDDAALTARLPHFTARTRTALRLGVERARSDGSPTVGTGHLLAGVLAEGQNLALHVLRALEIEPDLVAQDLRHRSLTEAGGGGDTATERFSSPAANSLELAVTEATALGHNYVGTEHLLLGLVAEPEGAAGHALRSLGAELRLTRRAVAAALAGYVHLRAQAGQATPDTDAGIGAGAAGPGAAGPGAAGPGQVASMLAGVVQRELQPLLRRIERLEEHAGLPDTGR